MEIKDRIKMIMEREKVPPRVFADTIGVQQSTLSHILNDRNNPSLDVVMKVHKKYNYVNIEWLLYGKGEMFDGANSADGDNLSPHGEQQLPLFDENRGSTGGENRDFAHREPTNSENRKEMAVKAPENAAQTPVVQEVRYIKEPTKKITEIRIFFDDGTYETFKPDK